MDAQEYEAWSSYMKSRKGTWTIDLIHDGQLRDLIAFVSDRDDHTRGVYVSAHGATIEAGRYEDAITHMGDAIFEPRWAMSIVNADRTGDEHGMAKPSPEVWKLVIERLGVQFLLGTLCNVPSHYRR